jgi:glycosyltransferase involved in cell wall biosynthesis
MKIIGYYPNYFGDGGIAHASYNIMKNMQSDNDVVKLFGLASDPVFNDSFYADFIPRWSKSLVYKIFPNEKILKHGENFFLKKITDDVDIAYLWPGISIDVYKAIKARGKKIIYEGVNTHEAYSKDILDREYKSLGLTTGHHVSAEKVIVESEKLALADFVYSASPIMTESYLENNVDPEKILPTSYGLHKRYIYDIDINSKNVKNRELTFIFVGSIDVRKGIHLLLKYWVQAGLNAKLKIVGRIDPAVEAIVNSYLSKYDNIEHIPFTIDLGTIYKNADVFILPSLEEGSPLVTYLAMGASLPIIVSPMGGGGVVQNEVEGFVIDPHDSDGWVNALHQLANDASLRERFARNSGAKAQTYVWEEVGKRRLNALRHAYFKESQG